LAFVALQARPISQERIVAPRILTGDRRVSLVTVEARIPSNCEPLGDAVSPEPLALNAAWKGFPELEAFA
jgi:hypothetical protein